MKNSGMVLISVLWVVMILSLVSFTLAASVRVEVASVQSSFDSERAFLMARGAAEVVFRSIANQQELPADSPVHLEGGDYVFPFDSGEARVRLESGSGKIDLNGASDRLLATVYDSVGLNVDERNRIVDSILDWRDSDDIPHLYGAEVTDYSGNAVPKRPRNSAFQTVDELLLVKNMTPDIFYGSLRYDALDEKYHRIPGVRDLVTVDSGASAVDPNRASADVLRALPAMNGELVAELLTERDKKPFSSSADIVGRVPAMSEREALQYMSFDFGLPTVLVSRGTITSSGVSRTVRMLFRREEKLQILTYAPLLYKKVQQIRFDRWRFE